MEQQQDNQAPGQQNFPKNDEAEDNKLVHPAEEIISGARQEDQLDKMKDNARENDNSNEQASHE